jgi:hypothetical protein
MTEGHAHEKCACSRNRQCALHRHQMRALTRRPQEEHRRERQRQVLEEGIEKLKQKYGGAK